MFGFVPFAWATKIIIKIINDEVRQRININVESRYKKKVYKETWNKYHKERTALLCCCSSRQKYGGAKEKIMISVELFAWFAIFFFIYDLGKGANGERLYINFSFLVQFLPFHLCVGYWFLDLDSLLLLLFVFFSVSAVHRSNGTRHFACSTVVWSFVCSGNNHNDIPFFPVAHSIFCFL